MASQPYTITVRVDDGDLARLEAVAERLERAAEKLVAQEQRPAPIFRVTGCHRCPFLCDTTYRCEASRRGPDMRRVDVGTLGVEPPPTWCPLREGPIAVTLEPEG